MVEKRFLKPALLIKAGVNGAGVKLGPVLWGPIKYIPWVPVGPRGSIKPIIKYIPWIPVGQKSPFILSDKVLTFL